MFHKQQMVTQAADVPHQQYGVGLENWPGTMDPPPPHRFLCRVQDDREGKEAKWYNGQVTRYSRPWGANPILNSGGRPSFAIMWCTAFADDGHKLHARSHNYLYYP